MSNRLTKGKQMHDKITIHILKIQNSKNSITTDILNEMQRKGYCIVETKLIDDKIIGLKPDFIIIDDKLD